MGHLRSIFSHSALREKPWLFLIDLVQLFCFFYLVRVLEVEASTGFPMIGVFVISAFTLANLINKNLSVHVFLLLGLVLIYYAFSWVSGTVLLVIFLAGFVWLSLRINIYLKISGFILLLLSLAFLRLGYVYKPRLYMVTPFVGVIFMFRGISYLYYLKNHQLKGSLVQRLAYFLMYPSLVFALFPIVDFKEFLGTYLVRPYHDTRQKAVRYLLRGLVHLLLYRILLSYVYTDESGVNDLYTLLQYIFSAYLLILRLSGILHLGMALVCLFGYDLPPVFHYYFLGTGFADLWRRINTYWRNFMQRVFFYPLYFKTKRKLGHAALPVSTSIMFVFTWFFHNYQLFWARGTISFTTADALFWTILGVGVTLNVVYLDYRTRNKIKSKTTGWKLHLKKSVFILLCFFYMSLLWSLWSSVGISNWLHTLSFAKVFTAKQLLTIVCVLLLLLLLIFAGHLVYFKPKVKKLFLLDAGTTRWFTLTILLVFTGAVFCANQSSHPAHAVQVLFNRLPFEQTGKQERGYYKQMMDGNSDAWEVSLFKPLPEGDINLLVELTTDLYMRKLRPSKSIVWRGKTLSTNAFGIRDREYSKVKPAGTLRIALLGGSYEYGSGVSNNEVFENVLEDELNSRHVTGDFEHVEILNFGCGAYHVIQELKLTQEKIPRYQPDILFLFAHTSDANRLSGFMADLIQSGINLEFDYLKKVKQASGVRQYMSESEIKSRLRPYMEGVIGWAYTEMAKACQARHIKPVWIFLPTTRDRDITEGRDTCKALAIKAGFETVDLTNVYRDSGIDERNVETIINSRSDPHPNAKGHALIAHYLFRVISQNNTIFKIKNRHD